MTPRKIGALGPGAIGGLLAAQLSKAGHMRRVPFGSEAGAFRFTLGVGLVIGASVFIGWVSVPAAGLGVFAAVTVSAALSRLWVALRDRPAALRQAVSEAALDGARPPAGQHVLVVANEALAGAELAELILQHSREHVEVDALAPVLASHVHYALSDIDGELAEAHTRLARSLAWAHEHKIVARGEVGDPNPTTALEDELRTSGADEVIVVTHPRDRETWQERGELARLRRGSTFLSPTSCSGTIERSGRTSDRAQLEPAPRLPPGNSSEAVCMKWGARTTPRARVCGQGTEVRYKACQDTRGWGEQRQVTRLTRALVSPLALALVDGRQSFAYRSIAGRC